jgi:hypothetical protein
VSHNQMLKMYKIYKNLIKTLLSVVFYGLGLGAAMADQQRGAEPANHNSTVVDLRLDLKSLLKEDRIRLWDPPYT